MVFLSLINFHLLQNKSLLLFNKRLFLSETTLVGEGRVNRN